VDEVAVLEGREPPALRATLRQEELAFMKAISKLQLSPGVEEDYGGE
jgi:hypothetical protein